jgi:hypothetical protein
MRFLTRQECRDHLKRSMLHLGEDAWKSFDYRGDEAAGYVGNVDSLYIRNHIRGLYTYILEQAFSPPQFLAHFGEMGVWPSSNDVYLSGLLWEANGCSSWIERPGILFPSESHEKMLSFLSLGFFCGWDSLLYVDYRNWLFISHDEYLRFRFEDEGLTNFIRAITKS